MSTLADAPSTIPPDQITALLLAGGRGSRMGGVDKGLQNFHGTPLALHALLRLQQQSLPPGEVLINANRNLAAYESFGVSVWPDALPDFAGPLAGFLTGLERCETPYLLTLPCDVPHFPLSLCERLAYALQAENADIAMAAAPEADDAGHTRVRTQPVFCLLRAELLESLVRFTHGGGRKIDAWTAQHRQVIVPFDTPDDDPLAFANANTLDELRRLEGAAP
ncbi:molybdenum cofactor guanylyltransferase MobA [Ottowia sp. GY511]|uniref:Molybdenum cofactor guanylyltransferase n=1 Tax=Ottowia flava TaxID=2675430 RepID=A0ABW4KXH1_9BURK|nr:molybdenum cofactor guanylyltransferase MobA [Ottowia sp. GY511]TXK22543.1 molybdenum cofactor guanylyltransferase MobA [Ottowia sp. GY511]